MIESIHTQLNDSQWLSDQILNKHKNCAQIARELGIANRSAVNRAVKKLGLADRVYRTKYYQLSDKQWLIEQLKTKTLVQIAADIGTTVGNVGDRVRRFGLAIPSGKSAAVKAGLKKRFPDGRFGTESSNWKGGRRRQNGYIRVHAPGHPNAVQRSVWEHRLVASKKLGRPLTAAEVVHHINGDKSDNRPENLAVHNRKDHFHQHYTNGENIQALNERIAELEKLLIDNNIDFS